MATLVQQISLNKKQNKIKTPEWKWKCFCFRGRALTLVVKICLCNLSSQKAHTLALAHNSWGLHYTKRLRGVFEPVRVRWLNPAWIMKRLLVRHYTFMLATESVQELASHWAFLTAQPGESMCCRGLDCIPWQLWAHIDHLLNQMEREQIMRRGGGQAELFTLRGHDK